MAARYIDWNRGGPYVFGIEDVKELKEHVNSNYAFARKIKNPEVVKCLFGKK